VTSPRREDGSGAKSHKDGRAGAHFRAWPSSRLALISRLANALVWALLASCLLAAVAALGVRPLGYEELVEHSGSMVPTLRVGDLLVTRIVTPSQVRRGEVVTFRDPHNAQMTITHRVLSVRPDGESYDFVTKGDANRVPERWSIASNGKLGVLVLKVPELGYVVTWLGQRAERAGAWLLLLIVVAGGILRKLWGTGRHTGTTGAHKAPLGSQWALDVQIETEAKKGEQLVVN
jgi:signal peptidase